jgi:hypothetical protein
MRCRALPVVPISITLSLDLLSEYASVAAEFTEPTPLLRGMSCSVCLRRERNDKFGEVS